MESKPLAIIVEDDIFLADIYSDTLHGIGMETRVFHDGESAMLNITQFAPSLIVLDLNLPKYSGVEIFHALRKNPGTAETWVIIATANPSQAADLNQMEQENQNLLILVKPVSVDQLDQLARRLVFQR